MRKLLFLIATLLVLIIAGCGKENDSTDKTVDEAVNQSAEEPKSSENEGIEKLKLQVLKGDVEKGVTVDNNLLYNELDKIIRQNPDIGAANDFSVFVVDTYHDDDGNSKLVLLGINRLPFAIKDFTFTYTLGNKDHEYVWERQAVEMKEETTGILQSNSALPIVLSITEEQETLLKNLEEDNVVMSIGGFIYEEVK